MACRVSRHTAPDHKRNHGPPRHAPLSVSSASIELLSTADWLTAVWFAMGSSTYAGGSMAERMCRNPTLARGHLSRLFLRFPLAWPHSQPLRNGLLASKVLAREDPRAGTRGGLRALPSARLAPASICILATRVARREIVGEMPAFLCATGLSARFGDDSTMTPVTLNRFASSARCLSATAGSAATVRSDVA